MTCPNCQGKSNVLETRESPHGTRRRRECRACGNRFTTYEVVVFQIAEQHGLAQVDVPDAAEIANEIMNELADRFDDRLAELPQEVVEALVAEAEQRSLGPSANGDRLALPAGDDEDDDD